jgi:hypothetical protein
VVDNAAALQAAYEILPTGHEAMVALYATVFDLPEEALDGAELEAWWDAWEERVHQAVKTLAQCVAKDFSERVRREICADCTRHLEAYFTRLARTIESPPPDTLD